MPVFAAAVVSLIVCEKVVEPVIVFSFEITITACVYVPFGGISSLGNGSTAPTLDKDSLVVLDCLMAVSYTHLTLPTILLV